MQLGESLITDAQREEWLGSASCERQRAKLWEIAGCELWAVRDVRCSQSVTWWLQEVPSVQTAQTLQPPPPQTRQFLVKFRIVYRNVSQRQLIRNLADDLSEMVDRHVSGSIGLSGREAGAVGGRSRLVVCVVLWSRGAPPAPPAPVSAGDWQLNTLKSPGQPGPTGQLNIVWNMSVISLCLSTSGLFFTKNSSWLWQIPEGESRSDLGKPIKVSKEYQKALYPNPMNGSNTGWYLFVISFLIEHEYSICVSWSENPNPPRNLSFFWFLNKIGNQLSFQAVLTVCKRYVKPTNRKF